MPQRPLPKSRAVAKSAWTGSYREQLALLVRVLNNFLLHPSVFPEGAAFAPTGLANINTAVTTLIQPKTAAVKAQIKTDQETTRKAISQTSDYINKVARGRVRVLLLSGIQMAKVATAKKKLSAVTNLRQLVDPSVTSGSIKLNWNKPKGTKTIKGISYLIEGYPEGHFDRKRDIGITNKTTITWNTGDLNQLQLFMRVTPIGGVPSPWIRVRAQF